MLQTSHHEPFTTGSIEYLYQTIPPDTRNLRIILSIAIEGIPVMAVIDTGAPFLVVEPRVALELGIRPQVSDEKITLEIRGFRYPGWLQRVVVNLFAQAGESMNFEATAFFPDASKEDWEARGLPTFLGVTHCLDHLRFAVDPSEDRFYFGPCP